jgi:hypothetical protein
LKFLQRFAFNTASEIAINYRKSALSQNASVGAFPKHAPQPGDRLPFYKFRDHEGNEINIQEKVRGKLFCLLVFNDRIPEETVTAIKPLKDFCSFDVIPFEKETETLYKRFGIKRNGCYLIRPDMYIAYRANKFNSEHLGKYIHSTFFVDEGNKQLS